MGLPQQKLQYQEMFFITGKVQQVIDTLYVVVIDQRKIRAVQAVGCLLVPETGDTVLLAENSADKAYILSILVKDKPNNNQISLPNDTVITARGGDLLLCSDKQITLNAPELRVQADKGVAEIKDTDFTADKVELSVGSLSAFWQTIERKADRVLERISRVYRRIGLEDSRMEQLHTSVDESCTIEAQDIAIEADERLRLDGERVELG